MKVEYIVYYVPLRAAAPVKRSKHARSRSDTELASVKRAHGVSKSARSISKLSNKAKNIVHKKSSKSNLMPWM